MNIKTASRLDVEKIEMEIDFCVVCNMLLELPYEQAIIEAKKWVKEAHAMDEQ